MSFISYAQNWEDVLLWRALGHVKNGFYIDVGANDPLQHSVTQAFYERGWYGINVEPLRQYRDAFIQQRPRDINLCVAAGAENGELTLFDVPSVPGWASADPAVAAAHARDGHPVVEHVVPVRTLDAICAEHVSHEIHFLKIDVEGLEEQVLRGIDFARWRPWVLVIEATLPNSPETNHGSWEPLVTAHAYRFAYFDGLNRYYVAEEHAELVAKLQVQANVFDDFISVHLAHAWRDLEATRTLAAQNEERAVAAQAAGAESKRRADDAMGQAMAATLKLIDSEARGADAALAHERLAHQLERQMTHAAYEAQQQVAQLGQQLEQQAAQLGQQLEQRAAQLAAQDAAAQAAAAASAALAEWAHELDRQLAAMRRSSSWRLTSPLRLLGRLARSVRTLPARLRQAAAAIARLPMRAAKKLLRMLGKSAPVRQHVLPHLMRIPAVELRVMRMAIELREPAPDAPAATPPPPRLVELPPAARAALAALERAQHTTRQP